mmetsp:Transcript_17523/g.27004  ORF Transcript_17523/g.27004 Transcript_17523/m.27004 type:complete len:83 (+) Transcript_17523:88-336(+)
MRVFKEAGGDTQRADVEQDMIMLGLRAPTMTEKRKPFMFYPNDTIKVMFWDLLISLLLLITCLITPFNLAFQDEVDKIEWYV